MLSGYKEVEMALQLHEAGLLFNAKVSERLKKAHFSDKNLRDLASKCAFLETYAPCLYAELNPNQTLKTLYPQIAANSPAIGDIMAIMLAMVVSGYKHDVRIVESDFSPTLVKAIRQITPMIYKGVVRFRVHGSGELSFHPIKQTGAK